MDLTYLLDMLGFGGPGASYAKPQPGVSVPKGTSTAAAVNPAFPQETLADSIGPWQTTVTPTGATPSDASTGEKTFGDKLSEALSGLGALQSPGVQMPSSRDIAGITKLALSGAPPTGILRLAEALLPRRR